MIVKFHKKFEKAFNRLPGKIQEKFSIRLELFIENPFNLILNNHAVDAAYPNSRSINITGDYRAIYEIDRDGDFVLFMRIGTHAELYG